MSTSRAQADADDAPTVGVEDLAAAASRVRARTWFVVAALTAAFSLGLPWNAPRAGYSIPGWFTPSFSSVNYYDNTISFTPSYFSPGFTINGTDALAGYQTDARLVVAIAVLLLVIAVRRRSRPLAAIGLGVAVLALAVTALVPTGGLVVYIVALLALVLALRTSGLLRGGRTITFS